MRVVVIAAVLLVQASLHAAWRDLKPGIDRQQTIVAIGDPLFVNKSRGYETWTYDRGGCVAFEAGRICYWQPPKPAPKPR